MRLVIVGALAIATASLAADQRITATKIELRRSPSGAEKLIFTSRDPSFLFPAIGGADDPSTAGATITVVSPLEAPVTFLVPAGIGNPGWRVVDRPSGDSLTYRNAAAPAGPSVVRSAKLRQLKSIKLAARETGLALTAQQGSVGIRITMGSLRLCALFDAGVVIDQPGHFLARGAVQGPADCSDAALHAPAVCGDGTVQSPEQCDGAAAPCAPLEGCVPPGEAGQCSCCSTSQCVNGFGCCPGSDCFPTGEHFPVGDPGLCISGCNYGTVCYATGLPCCTQPGFECTGGCLALPGQPCAGLPCYVLTQACVDGVCQ
jgi:hypothetical protein